MDYLLKRQGRYYYNRRVPEPYREYDSRKLVRIALKTDCRKAAIRLALHQNDQLECFWMKLKGSGTKHQDEIYQDTLIRAQALGHSYLPAADLAKAPLEELVSRLLLFDKSNPVPAQVTAVLGGVGRPVIKIDDALNRYFHIRKDHLLNKSPNQIRKWENPRKRAVQNLINCIGNKPLPDINRNDILKFRDWWIDRLQKENLVANSANKNLIHIKTIIETINDNAELALNTTQLFKKLLLDEDTEQRRLPFDTKFIVEHLLNPSNLKGLHHQAAWVLHAIAETGAGLSEQLGLMPEDIVMDHEIPHIIITPRPKRPLKTKYRKRVIPLVGFALDAFKACPKGFTHYTDRADALSAILGKYLREKKLLPTKDHSVYSLRHSFQDRLLAVNSPDRIQAELMGHKFNRQAYGSGGSLEQKLFYIEKCKLKLIT